MSESLVDLGMQPLSNAYIPQTAGEAAETFYPLNPRVCAQCFLVQLGVFERPENIFTDYAYFSSFSTSWLDHCRRHAESVIAALRLNGTSLVVEIASNDGYLLRNFVDRGIRVLGVEPAKNIAAKARDNGVETRTAFFGAAEADLIREGYGRADLMLANNVLAHVPDIHDFAEGFRRMLAPEGVVTFEFPHLVPLIDEVQFDTIYHEHFSYLSLLALEPIFAAHDLRVIDVERIKTHGGSLRLWVSHTNSAHIINGRVDDLRDLERARGLDRMETYRRFAPRVRKVKSDLLRFLLDTVERGDRVAAYGAAAKGNTLLNYCGVRADLVSYVVDRNPHKQGHLLPGSRIPICSVDRLRDDKPEYVLILPWNLAAEITDQMVDVRDWGGRFAVAVPSLTVFT